MSEREEKLARSLTAETTELIPHLPYLLQDLWELGSSPKDMIALALEHTNISRESKVLDLGCGKGAVSIGLAKSIGCKVKGIDILSQFIDYAKEKAMEYGVQHLCQFVVDDINESVRVEEGYDFVILGAVGDVLGNPLTTLLKLKSTIKQGGFIFLDDAYANGGSDNPYPSRGDWLQYFNKADLAVIAEKPIDHDELIAINRSQQEQIVQRARELMRKFPEKKDMFQGYIFSQQAECDELESGLTGVTWLLQKTA
ncbi:class I SAM-dependent methyltransferase [Dethiobacter alkaliphilus]|uniref:Methyltransferase type 12 n=1 Tax=Dethiobacter alkaliphilus AHT 1 TaxID=555088 RepID=C0GCH5_DETAL|nr:class I SAM-dependent methyltransferase [Dethiobacter alkaliphilus]EEG78910.1 Methyltransferase type 12 [Dethiobacter alkaliphilus AHT 1]